MKTISSLDPIDILDFSIRTYNALRRAMIQTVGDLINAEKKGEIRSIRNIGEKAYNEIIGRINDYQIVDSDINNESAEIIIMDSISDEEDKAAIGFEKFKIYHDAIIELAEWQKDQIQKQIAVGTLHKSVQFLGEPIADILEKTEVDQIWATKMYSKILDTTCVTEELTYLLNGITARNLNIFLQYYGFTQHTLEEISIPFEITRERVRQILDNVRRNILSRFRQKSDVIPYASFTRIQSALLLADQLGDEITYNQWVSLITQSGLLGSWIINSNLSTDTIELFFAICMVLSDAKFHVCKIPENLKYACELAVSGKPDIPAKTLIIEKTLDKRLKKAILRHSCFSGGINSKWISHEINIPLGETIDILEILGFYNVINDWFIEKEPRKINSLSKNHTFEHTLRKMTQYCGPLKIDSIISGLRHAVSRTEYPVPPPSVIQRILEDKGYTCEEDLWYWDGEIDEQLNEGEKVILKCFEENGSIVHHSELAQAFIDSDLSFAALHATLNRTPIIEKYDYALYKLRGLNVTYEEIQRAKNEGDRIPIDLEIVPDKAGIIKIIGCLGILPIGTGVFFTESLPNLVGEWQCVVRDKQCGNITVVDNEIKGLLDAFESLHCEVGDRVSMSFNTWDRKVSIEKVS